MLHFDTYITAMTRRYLPFEHRCRSNSKCG